MTKGLGERLEQARRRAMLTQGELAEKAGVSMVTISRIENGYLDETARASTVKKIARALSVEPTWLMFGEPTGD